MDFFISRFGVFGLIATLLLIPALICAYRLTGKHSEARVAALVAVFTFVAMIALFLMADFSVTDTARTVAANTQSEELLDLQSVVSLTIGFGVSIFTVAVALAGGAFSIVSSLIAIVLSVKEKRTKKE